MDAGCEKTTCCVLLSSNRVLQSQVLYEGKISFEFCHAGIVGRLIQASAGDDLLYALHRVVKQGEHDSQCVNFFAHSDKIVLFLLQDYLGVFHGSSGRSLRVYP